MLHSSEMPYEKRKRKKSARRWPSNFCDRCFFAHYPKKNLLGVVPEGPKFFKVALVLIPYAGSKLDFTL